MNYQKIILEIENTFTTNDAFSFQKNLTAKKYKNVLLERVYYITKPTLKEIIFHVKNNLQSIPKCSMCNHKELTFQTHLNEYRKYCSQKCLHSDSEQKSKNAKKALETLKSQIDLETGLNLSQLRAKRTVNTLKNSIDIETEKSLLEIRGENLKNSHKNF